MKPIVSKSRPTSKRVAVASILASFAWLCGPASTAGAGERTLEAVIAEANALIADPATPALDAEFEARRTKRSIEPGWPDPAICSLEHFVDNARRLSAEVRDTTLSRARRAAAQTTLLQLRDAFHADVVDDDRCPDSPYAGIAVLYEDRDDLCRFTAVLDAADTALGNGRRAEAFQYLAAFEGNPDPCRTPSERIERSNVLAGAKGDPGNDPSDKQASASE